MTFRTANIDWLSLISSHGLMTNDSLAALDISLNHSGFVSGGFARMLAVTILTDMCVLSKKNSYLWSEVKNNTSLSQHSIDAFLKAKYYDAVVPDDSLQPHARKHISYITDIDVWFLSESCANEATREVIRTQDVIHNAPTIGGFGHELIVGKNIFQFIKKLTGSAEEVLSSFDIKNAKVYLDRDGIHWSDEWAILEENRMLGIDDFSKSSILWRIRKWASKHFNDGYDVFRPGDAVKYVNALIKFAEMTENNELYRWGKKVKISELRGINNRVCDWLPPDSMLKTSSIYTGYAALSIAASAENKARVAPTNQFLGIITQ